VYRDLGYRVEAKDYAVNLGVAITNIIRDLKGTLNVAYLPPQDELERLAIASRAVARRSTLLQRAHALAESFRQCF
jgi:hypothetical protein